jgi:protease-4
MFEHSDGIAPEGDPPRTSPASFPGHPAHHPLTPAKWHQRENRRLRVVLAVETGLLVVLGLLVFMAIPAMVGGEFLTPTSRLDTELVRAGTPADRVAVVPVAGIIYSGMSGPSDRGGMADWVVEALEDARRDARVRAVVLAVESPGGSIGGSDLIHRHVKLVRDAGRPVVALFGSVAASGGYYVSAGANRIVAQPTTMTGSIGVIMQTFRVDELFAKIGVRAVTVKTGEYKDIGSPFRELSEAERGMLQTLADDAHLRFVSIVAEGRTMSEEEARAIADGRLLSASQAVALRLVDEIGYFEDAVAAAERLAGISNATVVRYRQPTSFIDLFSAEARGRSPALQLAEFLSGMGPAYLADTVAAPAYRMGSGTR